MSYAVVGRKGFAALGLGLALAACGGGDEAPAALVIRNVTVVPATGAEAGRRASVVIRGARIDRIVGVGEGEPADLEGARVIDGTGKYLMPGLIEMHAHVSKTRGSALGLFVAEGVTTVRDMGGDHAEILRWREEIRDGERVGPRLVIAGPYLESVSNVERMRSTPPDQMIEPVERTRIPVGTPGEAERIVDSLAAVGVDFLKIRTVTDGATYRAINAAAERHGLQLVGHVTGISVETLLEAGHDGIEHFLFPALDSLTVGERTAHWEDFAAAGIPIVPTLVTFTESIFPTQAYFRAIVADSGGVLEPRRAYLSRYLVLDWAEQVLEADEERREFFRGIWSSTLRNLREMHAAGVDILAGSDVAVLNIYPGSSLHDEMRIFQDSLGMEPAEVIARATRKPAEFLGIADSVGTVEEGAIADLILLERDPLDDVGNLSRIEAVILRGELYDDARLAGLRDAVRGAEDITVNDWPRRPAGEPAGSPLP